jgi:hypothetical protein
MAINPIVPVRRCPVCGNWTTDLAGMLWRASLWPFRRAAWHRQKREAGTCAVCGLPLKKETEAESPDDRRVL